VDDDGQADLSDSVLFGADNGPDAAALTLHHQADTVLEDVITFSDLVCHHLWRQLITR
jgi:hypothetical protein